VLARRFRRSSSSELAQIAHFPSRWLTGRFEVRNSFAEPLAGDFGILSVILVDQEATNTAANGADRGRSVLGHRSLRVPDAPVTDPHQGKLSLSPRGSASLVNHGDQKWGLLRISRTNVAVCRIALNWNSNWARSATFSRSRRFFSFPNRSSSVCAAARWASLSALRPLQGVERRSGNTSPPYLGFTHTLQANGLWMNQIASGVPPQMVVFLKVDKVLKGIHVKATARKLFDRAGKVEAGYEVGRIRALNQLRSGTPRVSGNALFSNSTNCCHTAGPQLAHSELLPAHVPGPLVPGVRVMNTDIQRRRMDATVLLIKAVGGGWNVTTLPRL
jgi:hypothetical protein